MTRQEERRHKLSRLETQRRCLVNRINAVIEEERNEVSRPKLRKLVGKCFRFTNSYGGSEKTWPLYAKIISFDEKEMSFLAVQFQHTSRKVVEIEYERSYCWKGETRYGVDSSWIPISQAEYNQARRSALHFVQQILAK